MSTESQIYRDLQKHLDKLPIGYPATESGVEIRILQHLFNPEEAKIATQLSIIPEPLKRIYKRVKKTGISTEELEQVLDRMVYKGSILASKEGDEKRYSNAMLAIGMYEFQVDRLSKDFARDWLQYLDEAFANEVAGTRIPQLRTIPVEKSIPVPEKYRVSTYDNVREIVDSAEGQIAVANCICRQAKDLVGESCTKTDLRETCIILPAEAEYYISVGIGRPITKEEAVDILEKAQEAGLVLQPVNSLRPEAICCCCGDCCGILMSVKKFPRPADFYATNYYAEVDAELCTGCEICVDLCQLDAITMVNSVAVVNRDRCIGCGNCVVNCTLNAVKLQKKEKELIPPKDTEALYTKIMARRFGKVSMLKMGAKMLLRLRV
ncbi:MAG: 4Fe-4S binding protein [Desulfobacteraceae bacterium]|nr:4Fe-4S binding protein [Desulfobacteraceae bacterium]